MRAPARVLIAALCVSLGCAKDEDDDAAGDDDATGASATGSASVSASGTSSADDTGPATASASATASAGTTGGDDGPATTDGDTGPISSSDGDSDAAGSDDGIGTCMPAADDECRECVKANCCDDWTACANDEVCACTLECHLAGASLGSCKSQCGGESETYKAVYFCGQMFCLGLCEWDCC